MWCKRFLKSLDDAGKKWPNLEKTIMSWLIAWNLVVIVVEMYKFQDQFKSVPGHDGGENWEGEGPFCGPVQRKQWKADCTHYD